MYYQEFCVNQVKNALSLGLTNDQLDSVAYKYALKGGLIRLYAETYFLSGPPKKSGEFKFWAVNFGSKRNIVQGRHVWNVLLCSTKAYKLCEDIENKVVSYKTAKKPYYEHIEPANRTYKLLLKLNGTSPSTTQIENILNRSKLVVLADDEKKYLDSAGYNVFRKEDEDLIKEWCANGYINQIIATEAINSMKRGNKYIGTKDNGTSYARIAHLVNYGVEFIWGKNPSLTGGQLIADYLNDHNHII